MLFRSFDCVKNSANNVYYLDSEPHIECYGDWSTTYMKVFPFAIFLVILYPLGIISLFAYILFNIRKRLYRQDIVESYGFLYVGYRQNWYWYKLVVLVRQLGIVSSTMLFSTPGPVTSLRQAMGCLTTLFIAMTIHFFADPQENRRLDRMESSAICISFINIFSGLIFLTNKASLRFESFLTWLNCILVIEIGRASCRERV